MRRRAGAPAPAPGRQPRQHRWPTARPSLPWGRQRLRGQPLPWAVACHNVLPAERQRLGPPPVAACPAPVRRRARSLTGRLGRETTTICS
jgi:hypothetical protein